jgi:hypothetical protein
MRRIAADANIPMKTIVPILSALVATAAVIVSVYLARTAHQRAIMPVLVFSYRDGIWVLKNVGSGPALNLRIARVYHTSAKQIWQDLIRLNPLPPKEAINLHYESAMVLAAVYTDAYGKKIYTSTCRDYDTTFKDGDEYGWDLQLGKF